MEHAAPSKDDKAALQRLHDLTLKGQFKKGVGDAMVLNDLERMEIRDPEFCLYKRRNTAFVPWSRKC